MPSGVVDLGQVTVAEDIHHDRDARDNGKVGPIREENASESVRQEARVEAGLRPVGSRLRSARAPDTKNSIGMPGSTKEGPPEDRHRGQTHDVHGDHAQDRPGAKHVEELVPAALHVRPYAGSPGSTCGPA